MVASFHRVAVAALSSPAVEVENHPLVVRVVVLGLVACACLEVEEAFFQVEDLLVLAVGCHS